MTSITIDTDNKNDVAELEQLAAKNGWHISYSRDAIHTLEADKKKKQHLSKLLKEYAQRGGFTSFGDNPSEWQRQIRVDKNLYGR